MEMDGLEFDAYVHAAALMQATHVRIVLFVSLLACSYVLYVAFALSAVPV